MARRDRQDPYNGFKSDVERRRALATKERRRRAPAVEELLRALATKEGLVAIGSVAVAATHLIDKLPWLVKVFH